MIGEFYTTHGKVLTSPADEEQTSRANYLAFLEGCGRQYLLNKELKEEQKSLLGKGVLDF